MFHRLFFALWPADALRHSIDEAASRLERELQPGGRRLNAARYHLTLQFLGEFESLPQALIADACAAAAEVRLPPFGLVLDCAGSFRGSDVWWLGTRETPAGLQGLWSALGDGLARYGVPTKPAAGFSPHLTIQRNVRRHIATTPIEPLDWPVHDFVLMDSQSGQPYRIIGRWLLPE
ncbi:RNA 2',3'-cyclic phosphodiesterase [Lysobacter sp. S4-A87]|uniref:RNA 2',3'-cyclic phosphodiesterase n=1 Tax=Lysobacter sp. S4-A87 TaxID=2925843 RepID=UPI001F52B80E|nr:RNA 2',3'-cyclic phosphodiesterase [Lysobacter sp. S4-A87]UNK49591.1 RNA 2',3'-cyclic phosphodiesterase [Lysobacter sp. S4-A87]